MQHYLYQSAEILIAAAIGTCIPPGRVETGSTEQEHQTSQLREGGLDTTVWTRHTHPYWSEEPIDAQSTGTHLQSSTDIRSVNNARETPG